jgi:hypothetical protein
VQVVEDLRDAVEGSLPPPPQVVADLPIITTLVSLDVEDLTARRGELPVRPFGQVVRGQGLPVVRLRLRPRGLLGGARAASVAGEEVSHAEAEGVHYVFQVASGVTREDGAAAVALL